LSLNIWFPTFFISTLIDYIQPTFLNEEYTTPIAVRIIPNAKNNGTKPNACFAVGLSGSQSGLKTDEFV